ncbi:hypothetical protein GCM10027258_36430 [Amycolatopsis stemonae]
MPVVSATRSTLPCWAWAGTASGIAVSVAAATTAPTRPNRPTLRWKCTGNHPIVRTVSLPKDEK